MMADASTGVKPPTYWGRVALLVLCAVLPTAYRAERALLLVCGFLFLFLVFFSSNRLRLHRSVLCWALVSAIVGTLFALWGGFRAAPGVPRVMTVYVIWPLILTFTLGAFSTHACQQWVVRGLLAAQFLICSYAVLFVLYTLRLIPAGLFPNLDLDPQISLSGGFFEISFHSLNSLMFLVPFSVATVLVWNWRTRLGAICTIAIAALGVLCAAVSGRRALQLVTVISPAIVLGFALFTQPLLKAIILRRVKVMLTMGTVVFVAAGASILFLMKVDPMLLWEAFAEGFAVGDDLAQNQRAVQLAVLLREWTQNPMLGAGLGASAVGLLRSGDQPWAYELSYVALLFQVGLIGMAFYVAAIGWIYVNGLKIVHQQSDRATVMIPFMTGLTAFLVSNATNPYLAAFDYLWTLFLPIAVINGWLLDQRRPPPPSRT